MKGKTKTVLTILIAILVVAIAAVGTVTFLKDDGEASAAEENPQLLPVAGSDDGEANANDEENPSENLNNDENEEEQPEEEIENQEEGRTENTGTTTDVTGGTTGNQTEPEATTIEQERLVSTTLGWSGISLNSTIGRTGINYTNLPYTIKYFQVKSEEEVILLNTETGKENYGETVTVTDEKITENCPEGYKLKEEANLSVVVTENIEANLIEVYYIKDRFDLNIKYEYEDGTPATDPFVKDFEYEEDYYIESPEIEGYTPSEEVVEGTMSSEDTEVTVTYKPNTDVSYIVKYLEKDTEKVLAEEETRIEKTFNETYKETAKPVTGYTVELEEQEIKLDAYGKELVFYYTVNKYNATFELNNGEDDIVKTQDYGTDLEAPTDPEKEGHTFTGWDKEVPETMPAEDTTYVAQWEVNKYTVTYYVDGVQYGEVETYDYGTAIIQKAEPTKTGYTFSKWDITLPEIMPAYDIEVKGSFKANSDVSYTVRYLEKGTEKVLAEEETRTEKTFNETYKETAKEITGYTAEVKEQEIKLDEYNKVLTFYYTANSDVSYTVRYLEKGTEKVLAEEETRTEKTFNETYKETAKEVTGYTAEVKEQEIKLDEYNKVLTFYYTKNTYAYSVEYYYENLNGVYELAEPETEVGTAKYQDVINTFEAKDQNGNYVLDYVTPANSENNKVANLVITENTANNVLKVYYLRNSFDYKVEYYKDSVNGEKLGETKTAKEKLKTVLTDEIISEDFGNNWKNSYKPNDGYQDGAVVEYITIESNNNIVKVIYRPRTDLRYSVEYYFNGELDSSKGYTENASYQERIQTVKDYSNNGEWTVDEVNSTVLPFTIGLTGNTIKVYYVKADITVEKTRTVNTNRTTGAAGTVEPGETITYTITATNNGYKEGTVTIADTVPQGTTLTGNITVVGNENSTVSQDELAQGLVLTVPAKTANGAGTASVTFTVTVTAKPGNDIVNTPTVNGEEDESNTVTNPVEKTVSVKAQTETITGTNVVLVLDTSGSMEGNRLKSAKAEAIKLINKVIPTDGGSTGGSTISVIEFGGNSAYAGSHYRDHANLVGTATNIAESSTLKQNVNNLDALGGTPIGLGLTRANTLIGTFTNNNKNVIILLSDGEPDTIGHDAAATAIKQAGTKIYTIGFGTNSTANSILAGIASPGCDYTSGEDDLANAFNAINSDLSGEPVSVQSNDAKVLLDNLDNTKTIVIKVNGTALEDITGKIIEENGEYYLDLNTFNPGDSIVVEYIAK